jgi:O-antigen ligase/tetratricopeptide (TPR) repeat protein
MLDTEKNERSAATKASRVFFVVGVALSGVALGGVYTETLAAATLVLGIAFGLAYLAPSARPFHPKSGATALVVLGLGLVAYTALTLVPLPAGLVASIAPHNADVWARALRPFGESGPAMVPLTLDPTATRIEVLRGLTYVMAFATAHRITQSRGGTELLERLVVGAALFMAAASILHPVLGAEKVLGLYRPKNAFGTHVAPILNPNHLAGYMNLGVATGVGVLVSARSARERLIVGGIVLFLVGMELFVASRGGIATTVLGAAIVFVLHRQLRRGQSAGLRATPILVGAALVVGVGLLVVAGNEQSRTELHSRDTSKLDTIVQAFRMVPSSPVFGVGRGAFESVFPEYRTGIGYVTVTHPENVLAQWVTEWGIPCTLLVIGVLLYAFQPKHVLSRSKPPLGAYAALAALAVHNLVDFSSELPGVVVLASVCAAIVTGGVSDAKAQRPLWARYAKPLAATTMALAAGVGFVCIGGMRGELHADQDRTGKLSLDRASTRKDLERAVREASLRHPGEPYFSYVGAIRGQIMRDGPIVPFAARTLERSPVHGPMHLVLARAFARSVPSQARVEYRLALAQQIEDGFAEEAPRLVGDYDEALELTPEGPQGPRALELLALGVRDRLPSTRYAIDKELLARDPKSDGALARLAKDTLLDLQQDASWCADRKACANQGLELTRRLIELRPTFCEGHALAAEIRAAGGATKEAVHDLEEASDRVDDRSLCLGRLVALMDATGLTSQVENTIDRVANAGCVSPAECAENYAFAGRLCQERGSPRRAIGFFRKAVDRAPERDDLLLEYARLAGDLGLHAERLYAYTRLSELHPDIAEYVTLAAEEREALSRTRFGQGLGLPDPPK